MYFQGVLPLSPKLLNGKNAPNLVKGQEANHSHRGKMKEHNALHVWYCNGVLYLHVQCCTKD